MILIIHGFPPTTTYGEIQELISEGCNIDVNNFMLDTLSVENGGQKVRIGTSDESDGNTILNCLDGFLMSGSHVLRVESVKAQQKTYEKPLNKRLDVNHSPEGVNRSYSPTRDTISPPQDIFNYGHGGRKRNPSPLPKHAMSDEKDISPPAQDIFNYGHGGRKRNPSPLPKHAMSDEKDISPPAQDILNYGHGGRKRNPSPLPKHAMSDERDISPPGRRASPSGHVRRASPLRRISPSERRRSSSSRSISPERRISPSRRRVSRSDRRWSPKRRMSPRRRISPGRRYSPIGHRRSPGRRSSPGRSISPRRRSSPGRSKSPGRRSSPRRSKSPGRRSSPRRSKSPRRRSSTRRNKSPRRRSSTGRNKSPGRRLSPGRRKSPDRRKSSKRRLSPDRCNSPKHRKSSERQLSPRRLARDEQRRLSPNETSFNYREDERRIDVYSDLQIALPTVCEIPADHTLDDTRSNEAKPEPIELKEKFTRAGWKEAKEPREDHEEKNIVNERLPKRRESPRKDKSRLTGIDKKIQIIYNRALEFRKKAQAMSKSVKKNDSSQKLKGKFLTQDVKMKRQKAVDVISEEILSRHDFKDEQKRIIHEKLKLALMKTLDEMLGFEDVSYIELVNKYRERYSGPNEDKIWTDVLSSLPSYQAGVKGKNEGWDVPNIPLPKLPEITTLSIATNLPQNPAPVKPQVMPAYQDIPRSNLNPSTFELNLAHTEGASAQLQFGSTQAHIYPAQVAISSAQTQVIPSHTHFPPAQPQFDCAQAQFYSAQVQIPPAQTQVNLAHTQVDPAQLQYYSAQAQVHLAQKQIFPAQTQVNPAHTQGTSAQLQFASTQGQVHPAQMQIGSAQMQVTHTQIQQYQAMQIQYLQSCLYQMIPNSYQSQIPYGNINSQLLQPSKPEPLNSNTAEENLLYLCQENFEPFATHQVECLQRFLINKMIQMIQYAMEANQGWIPDIHLRGLNSACRYEVSPKDQASRDWLLNLDFSEFENFNLLVYTKEELWYERAAIWLPGHSGFTKIEPLQKLSLQNKHLKAVNIGKWKFVKKVVSVQGTRLFVDMPPSAARALERHMMKLHYELSKVTVSLKASAVNKATFDAGLKQVSIKDTANKNALVRSSPIPILNAKYGFVKIKLDGVPAIQERTARKLKEILLNDLFNYLQLNLPSTHVNFIRYGMSFPDSLGIVPANQRSKKWLLSRHLGFFGPKKRNIIIIEHNTYKFNNNSLVHLITEIIEKEKSATVAKVNNTPTKSEESAEANIPSVNTDETTTVDTEQKTREAETSETSNISSPYQDMTQQKASTCSFCNLERHTLAQCFRYQALSSSAKKKWAKRRGQKLCFICLGQHLAKHCSVRGFKYNHSRADLKWSRAPATAHGCAPPTDTNTPATADGCAPLTDMTQQKASTCSFCNLERHTLAQCYKYQALSSSAKRNWAMRRQLCFICHGQHLAKHCSVRGFEYHYSRADLKWRQAPATADGCAPPTDTNTPATADGCAPPIDTYTPATAYGCAPLTDMTRKEKKKACSFNNITGHTIAQCYNYQGLSSSAKSGAKKRLLCFRCHGQHLAKHCTETSAVCGFEYHHSRIDLKCAPLTDTNTPATADGCAPPTNTNSPATADGCAPLTDTNTPATADGCAPPTNTYSPATADGCAPPTNTNSPATADGCAPLTDTNSSATADGCAPPTNTNSPATADGCAPLTDTNTPATADGCAPPTNTNSPATADGCAPLTDTNSSATADGCAPPTNTNSPATADGCAPQTEITQPVATPPQVQKLNKSGRPMRYVPPSQRPNYKLKRKTKTVPVNKIGKKKRVNLLALT